MDADSAWDRLVAESGDDVDIATMVAQSNIEDAQKALDKAKKQTPKLVGTTEEKLAAAKAFKESVVKAQNDLAKWQEIADVPKRRASLQTEQTDLQTESQTESQGQQVTGKLPASEKVGPTETTPVEEVAQIEESAPIEEQTKGNVSTMSQETDQVEEEKDVVEELRERNRVGNERDQRAGRPPRPSDYIEAIGKGDDKAMKAWEEEFNDYAQKLNADDLPDIESTIRQMQGHIDTIRSGNPKGYKDNSAYKAYSGIKKMLEKRRRELNKQSAEGNTRLSARSNVGLVEDARTRTLGDKTRKMLDAMAKRLGLQVEFVDEIVTGKDEKGNNTYANADIVGNKVRIAWDKRDQALDFLLGHEFTHRMQNLSPEAYAEFVEAAKQALGEEEWNKRINRMKSLYKQHGIAISEQGIIDEVVADYAGELVEERGVFDNFVERNKENRGLLSKIADVLRSIKEFFTLGKQRKINNAIARLEALIESASEANLRGDAVSSEEQRNSLIGEQGATALDKAEEATHRMDNLAVARDMEAEGKDAKSIRMATGWERGADGKWRYEIEDIGEIETPDEAIARMEKERKAIEKDRERLDYVVYQRLPRNATEEQKAKMKELRKRHKELVKKSSELWNAIYDKSNSKLGVHLSEYIGNDNELLKAYPELRNIDVSFVENSAMINEGFNGSFNGHTIWINPYAENARSILIHEIQHAIQNIEGFAKGGNNKTADMLRDKARVWAWRNALIHTAKERPELLGTTAVEKALIEEYKEDGLEDYIPSEEQRIKGLNLYLRGYDNEGYEQAYNQMHKVMPGEDYTTYRRLAGEVESRNAQKRMDMTAEQRRETLLSETEDVAREDQIFLMENGGVNAQAKSEKGAQYSLQGNSMTEEEQRIVDEAKANGTFDASNPDIRYSLATDMARDAVMTALEGAGIDVEMATPEMVEDVLRARDGKLMNFANSKEEFNRRFELAERNFGIVAKGLNDAVLTIVKLDNHPFTGTLKEARRQAQTWANQNLQGKEFDMPNNGGKYKISKDAIKKYLDKSAIGESVNPFMHLSTLLKLTEVIANSVDAEIHPDYKKDSNNNRSPENGIKSKDMLVHRLYGAVELDGVIYRTKTTVYEYINKGQDNSPHTYEVNEIELDDNPSAFPKIGVRKHSDVSTNSISVAKLLNRVDKSYDKSKKLLEESEKNPQFHIAYHGSGAKFDEFDHSHMGEGEGAQAYGWGSYLTEVEGIAKMYAGANGATMLTYKGNELDTDGLLNQWRVIKDLYDENKGRLREMRNRAERILSLVEEDNTEMKQLWQSVVDTLKQVRAGDLKVKPKRNLYTVEIPDDTGKNYLDYDKEMSKKELNEVRNKLEAILAEGDYKGVEKELKRELDSVFVDGLTASDVYGNVSAYLGGDKQASEFFNEMGYVGIKYPANYRSGGNEDGKKNFVIFNDSDMKITDRVEFLQTPNGTVYGWTIGGKIFLTMQGMNAETPIHEYTHLWANAMRRNNEQGWESVKDLLRGTPMWDEVLADKNYSNIHDNEDLVASEVLSRYSGKENAKRLEDEAQRMIDEAKGIGAKADAVSLIDRVRRALQKFWDWVGKDLFGIKDFDSIEQVTDRVLYDLMNQTDLNAEVSEGEGQQMRYSLRTKPEPKKTIKVYKLFNVDENGNPQALFIDAANSLEVGVWYDADSPTIKDLEGLETEWSYLLDNEGNVVDKKPLKRGKGGNFVGLPSKADVNKATQEGQRWMTVSTSKSGEKAYHTVGINGAGGVSTYALRPGWHATNVLSARHIGVGKDGANAKYRGANQRWFEIEISADVDYNEEARERYLKAHPTYSREKAYSDLKGDIPERIPEDGYYNFKTNSNANPNQDWYIAGAIKIVRPLTEEEGRKISRSKGIAEDLPYKDGVKNFDDSEVRYSLSTGNIERDNQLGKALYTINKEAKRVRDLKSEVYNQGLTDDVLKEIQSLGGISKSFNIENGGVWIETSNGGRFRDLSDVKSSIRESVSEISELESKLQDTDLEEDEKADIENDLEFEEENLDELRDIESAFEEYDAIDKYDAFSLFNERIDELYAIKEGVLNELIANGSPDGIHSFPSGDIRRVYKLGDYSFHGKDISDETLSEEEQNSIEDLEEISSENKLDDKISVEEALNILSEYTPQKARYSLSADKAPTKLSKRAKKYKTEKIFGGIWIANPQEFAKFVAAVNRYAFEEDGEGITYTDKYFYAYYWNIEGEPIPFIRINLKAKDSREVIEEISKKYYNDKGRKRIDRYIHHALERLRSRKSASSNLHSHNSSVQSASRNGRLGSHLLRKGEYFDNRSLYVKTQRTDRLGQEVGNSWHNLNEEQRTEIASNSQLQSLLYATSLWDEVADSGSYSNDDAITKEVLNHLDERAIANANSKAENAIDTFDKANAYDEVNRLGRALKLKQELMAEYRNESKPLFSLQGGRSIADKYEKKVNTKGKG